MKYTTYMLLRLTIPLLALVIGLLQKSEMLIGFFLGYFLCWSFSFATTFKQMATADNNDLTQSKKTRVKS